MGSGVETGARDLWDSLAAVYRQPVVSYTDFEAASKKVLPRQRHKSVGKIGAQLLISKDSITP
jgi:hypothetical protein